MKLPQHLALLESEAIGIIREGVATARNPVLLFSAGKDSTVLAHLALRAFHPGKPPVTLLHVDSTWDFQELYDFRDRFVAEHDLHLEVYSNPEGVARGLDPLEGGDTYTTVMRTDALRQALDQGGYDVIFGGARRDEEASRSKERVCSVRERGHVWEPRRQRPELWNLYNTLLDPGQTVRVFPLSNWTEHDLWTYILVREIELAPLYFATERPVVERDGALIVVDDADRLAAFRGVEARTERVRFRTLGCWPVTAAIRSEADDLAGVFAETLTSGFSERQGRVSDGGSLEQQKRAGYF